MAVGGREAVGKAPVFGGSGTWTVLWRCVVILCGSVGRCTLWSAMCLGGSRLPFVGGWMDVLVRVFLLSGYLLCLGCFRCLVLFPFALGRAHRPRSTCTYAAVE